MISQLILIEHFRRILALGDHHGPAVAMPQDIEQLINFCAGLETWCLVCSVCIFGLLWSGQPYVNMN